MPRLWIAFAATAGVLATAAPRAVAQSTGQETHVLVHVLAHDAKLIGTSVGGARVTVTNVATGELLATGVTSGGTGDTRLIMQTAHERGAAFLATEGAAGFRAGFVLASPTVVQISATGPLNYPQARAHAATTLLLEPGADIGGNGIVLDLHGLIVEILDASQGTANDGLAVRARVRMLCSCPTQPGGLWSVGHIVARLMDGDEVVAEAPLAYAGETSVYSGTVHPPRPGAFTLVVLAADSGGGNLGIARQAIASGAAKPVK